MEESDLSLQLFAAGWQIYEAGELRVFHDTDLAHHQSPRGHLGSNSQRRLVCVLELPNYWLGMGSNAGGK